ncbi:MAG: RNA polymerase sigma-70 factor [Dysgonomonas sp.]
MYTEDEIIKGLVNGKEEAYKHLYDVHYDALCIYANHYVDDNFIAETIVGDIIFSLWQSREQLNITHTLRSYLMKAVKNRCINHFGYLMRLETLKTNLKTEMESASQNYESTYDYPLSRILEKELDLKIQESISKLPDLTRRIFELSRFSDMSYQDIAEATGVSHDSVKYHIKSALAKLREDLKYYFASLIILFCM